MGLETRKPTGKTAWPRVLLGGGEKTGKSWLLAELSASPKIGRTLVLVLGEEESKWDEYGLIEGARFELIKHDGTWPSIMGQIEAFKAAATEAHARGEKPWVLGFDTSTAEWEGHKDWASNRARSTQKAKEILAADPNAEIVVSPNYWNDAHRRHRQMMTPLLLTPAIVVFIAREKEVTFFQNDKPVAGKKVWKVEAEDSLPFDTTAHIRLMREEPARLVSAFGYHVRLKPGKPGGRDTSQPMADGWTLESFIFETLRFDPAAAAIGGITEMRPDASPEQIIEEARRPATTFKRVRELHALACDLRYDGMALPNERGQDEQFVAQLIRLGKAKQHAEQQAAAAERARARDEAIKLLDPADDWLLPINDLNTSADEAVFRANFDETFASKPDDPRVRALRAVLDYKRGEIRRAEATALKAAA